jgi:elongation factor G
MSYATKDIRNIALLGHGGNGKSSLAESILFVTGAIDRQGRIPDGNTVSDYDPEEIRRQISISASTMFTEYKKTKINIIDTPGYFDFAGEVAQALRVADAGIIVVSAKEGFNVGTEKAWTALDGTSTPRAIYISKTDEEHANFYKAFNSLREKFGTSVCPMAAPIIENEKVVGIIDVATKKAYKADGGKRTEIPVPADMQAKLDQLYVDLSESVAETSEELREKYFAGESFTDSEINEAIGSGLRDCSICPVFFGSAVTGLGITVMLDAVVNYFPYPAESGKRVDETGPAKVIVYKTISDQFGKFSLFKVISGKVTADMTLTNARSGAQEKLGHIYFMQGKKNIEVQEISCGDIGAVSKLSDTKTGDTLCDPKNCEAVPGITYAPPCYSMAISPKTKGQEDKISQGLTRLAEEDKTFTIVNNGETHQMVVSGAGDIHLDVLCSKLKNKFGVEVELSPARVPYREKIRKPLKAHGRHKKQSGGHGQFGDVWIEFEAQDEQEDMIFAENVFGGSVPKNFFPAVEKGLRECIAKASSPDIPWSISRPPCTTVPITPSIPRKWRSRPPQALPTRSSSTLRRFCSSPSAF